MQSTPNLQLPTPKTSCQLGVGCWELGIDRLHLTGIRRSARFRFARSRAVKYSLRWFDSNAKPNSSPENEPVETADAISPRNAPGCVAATAEPIPCGTRLPLARGVGAAEATPGTVRRQSKSL